MEKDKFKAKLKKIGEGIFLVAGLLMCLPVALQLIELLRYLITWAGGGLYRPLFCESFYDQLIVSLYLYFGLMVVAFAVALPVFRESPNCDKELS